MIGILFTGGTISMKVDPATGAPVPVMSGADLLDQVPQARGISDVEIEDFSRLPGWQVTPEHMWRLARRAAAWLERPDIDGLVVTHGTDTIEETAYFLDLILLSPKPIVVVGSLRNVSQPGWDGAANLLNGVRVAASASARGRGTLVAMNDQIFSGEEVRKLHTERLQAFGSPEFGPIGAIDNDVVRFIRSPERHEHWQAADAELGLRVGRVESRVDLITAVAGSDERFILSSLESGVKGLVIEGMGRGNVPPGLRKGLQAAVDAGLPVVLTSRCVAGSVSAYYGSEGGGLELRERGVIAAGRLAGVKARLKLMIALGFTSDSGSIKELFERQA